MKDIGSKVNRMFGDLVKGRDAEGEVTVRVDVYETKEAMVFELDLPGFEKADVKVQIREDNLVIQGKRKRSADIDNVYFHTRERKFGSFQREFPLTPGANPENIRAKFENGVLYVTIPLPDSGTPRKDVEIV